MPKTHHISLVAHPLSPSAITGLALLLNLPESLQLLLPPLSAMADTVKTALIIGEHSLIS